MRFYLSNKGNPIDEHHGLWQKPLPVSRQAHPQADVTAAEQFLTYGEYFSAVKALVNACPEHFSSDNVSIFLEKHGAFYHPSRIVVHRGQPVDAYVLNVAFSNIGRHYLENEYNTLKMLDDKYGYAFLPKVFAFRTVAVDSARTVSMFLGEWFGSFHEFHISRKAQNDSGRVRVWDPVDSHCLLSQDQAGLLYEQAAMILTACYDIETFEQISAWHHAAGDFVVNLQDSQKPAVKLITVRRYTPLLDSAEPTSEAMINGLLLFLLNLSLHMRLDRLDGIKEICWLADFTVGATLSGFFQGLALQLNHKDISDGFIDAFKSYLIEIDPATLQTLFRSIAGRFPKGSADTPIIQSHIQEHVHMFYRALQAPA
jgi:hypothetical protein